MLILNDAPTVANCVKYAKAFGRGYGSIEQIYRWAATPQKDIQGRRETDAFIEQIKRVSRLLGRRAYRPSVWRIQAWKRRRRKSDFLTKSRSL